MAVVSHITDFWTESKDISLQCRLWICSKMFLFKDFIYTISILFLFLFWTNYREGLFIGNDLPAVPSWPLHSSGGDNACSNQPPLLFLWCKTIQHCCCEENRVALCNPDKQKVIFSSPIQFLLLNIVFIFWTVKRRSLPHGQHMWGKCSQQPAHTCPPRCQTWCIRTEPSPQFDSTCLAWRTSVPWPRKREKVKTGEACCSSSSANTHSFFSGLSGSRSSLGCWWPLQTGFSTFIMWIHRMAASASWSKNTGVCYKKAPLHVKLYMLYFQMFVKSRLIPVSCVLQVPVCSVLAGCLNSARSRWKRARRRNRRKSHLNQPVNRTPQLWPSPPPPLPPPLSWVQFS